MFFLSYNSIFSIVNHIVFGVRPVMFYLFALLSHNYTRSRCPRVRPLNALRYEYVRDQTTPINYLPTDTYLVPIAVRRPLFHNCLKRSMWTQMDLHRFSIVKFTYSTRSQSPSVPRFRLHGLDDCSCLTPVSRSEQLAAFALFTNVYNLHGELHAVFQNI